MTTKIDIFADDPDATLEYMEAVLKAKREHPDWQVQHKYKFFYNACSWVDVEPQWNWGDGIFRIHPQHKPEKRVPLTMDDLPPVFWVRGLGGWSWHAPITICEKGIFLTNETRIDWEDLSAAYEYSIDRKEVKPFWKEE